MALLVRAFCIEKINGWDETALHDYLRTNLALRRRLGFESLPAQSTFWRDGITVSAMNSATPGGSALMESSRLRVPAISPVPNS